MKPKRIMVWIKQKGYLCSLNTQAMEWLNHPAISIAYVCEKLYGNRDKNTTSKFHQKLTGKYGARKSGFSDEEKDRLKQIRTEIISELVRLELD